eukprot:CAMPEP_0183745772 /NCGR_PEP_ID=MMETSP0737-20130205/66416_1 /TAXON_ID=385413 /ORGANISM="Thalassiosira miniscula, Strain CCMP1093" /LENGTH=186 /DNA_ID=CAMNT_0025981451 /DNA_START=1170 /DNA_END=1727 /DNA_ORIENTATION=+
MSSNLDVSDNKSDCSDMGSDAESDNYSYSYSECEYEEEEDNCKYKGEEEEDIGSDGGQRKANTLFIYNGEDEVPKDVKSVKFAPYVTKVPAWAFRKCHALKYVELNESLQYIGKQAFEDCDSLESIHISSNVVEIGKGAFQKCRALKYLSLNESLRKIGEYAFQECDSLGELSPVLLNEGLESIGA